ncbi:transmembrane protein 131-like isoform X1, partial [Tachysurus ichikawai]
MVSVGVWWRVLVLDGECWMVSVGVGWRVLVLDGRALNEARSADGSCLGAEDEGRLSLQISLSERGERPAHLDKLKPYVLENIMVLLVLPPPEGVAYPKIGVYMLNAGVKQLFVK